MTLLPDFFIVEIYNMSDEDRAVLNDNEMIYVYGRDDGLLCCGEIDDTYTREVDSNTITTLSIVDGKSFWNTWISKSFGGGSSVKTIYESIVQNASRGLFTADDVRLIRGQTYDGRLAECVSMLARSVHARGFITNNTVFITAKGKTSEVATVNEDDIIEAQDFATGIRIVKTDVKGYPAGALCEVSGNQYRLVSQKFDADNYDGNWDSYLILADEKELSDGGMEGG